MRFLDLSVNNIGVFRGTHSFDLSPSKGAHLNRHITVITGHNGAGKTTLFRMIPLALHGSLAIGERLGKQAFNNYLHDLLHRHNTRDGSSVSRLADVAVKVAYVQSGITTEIGVRRIFKRHGRGVTEELSVTQDGEKVATNDPQGWLNDLIPVGLLSVCFFDAEELASLVGGSTKTDALLRDTIRRLLGLYLVERLQADLKHYILKQGGGKDTDNLREKLLQEQSLLESLDGQLASIQKDHAELESEQKECQAALAQQERRLLAEGGDYAKQRPLWQKQLTATIAEIERLEELVREHSNKLLPFTLAPQLVMQLNQRLGFEAELRRKQIAIELWQHKAKEILAAVEEPAFWQEIDLPSDELKAHVSGKLQSLLDALQPEQSAGALIHDLSSSEVSQLKAWIHHVCFGLDQQIIGLGGELRTLRERRQRLDEDLQRVPEDDALAAIHQEIAELQTRLKDVYQRQLKLSEQLGKTTAQREEHFRKFERARKEYEAAKTGERGADLAVRSQRVLYTYQDALVKQRLEVLEKTFVEAFNRVCRKEHLLTSVMIHPETFSVELRSINGRIIELEELSAGERQLYVLSLFRALRQISGYQLPLFVDTPFARLDEAHRQRLLEHYLPDVSDQVVLFTNDAEERAMHPPEAQHNLARTYTLIHDTVRGETIVTTSSFTGTKASGLPLEVVHGN